MTPPTLAITGSTGKLGRLVTINFAIEARPHRLLIRPGSESRTFESNSSEIALASYGDFDAVLAALEGIDIVFMVSASENPDRLAEHRTFVDAAAKAGVKHIVYTSFLGAAPDATFTLARDHFHTEERIRASGIAYTFLRDSLYLDFLPLMAGPDGVIRGPAGDGVVGFVAREDIARVAFRVLQEPEAHIDRTYDLTGSEALSLTDAARILTENGTPTTFQNETLEEAHASRASYNAPPWQVEAWISTYTAIAKGDLAAVNENVRTITHFHPLTLYWYLDGQRRIAAAMKSG